MPGANSVVGDVTAGIVVVVALTMRFVATFLDHTAHMQVHWRTWEMARPGAFTAETSRIACAMMAEALSFEDASTGEYTDVACSE